MKGRDVRLQNREVLDENLLEIILWGFKKKKKKEGDIIDAAKEIKSMQRR